MLDKAFHRYALLAGLLFAGAVLAAPSPYVDAQRRAIKALTAQQVEELLAGSGMGYAIAAELNGYPGPKHVLELAGPLRLDAAQRAASEQLYERMSQRARQLGAERVAVETELDAAFAEGAIDERRLQRLVARSARLDGELRALHLRTHLAQRELLDAAQRSAYQRLRGYHDAAQEAGHAHHGH